MDEQHQQVVRVEVQVLGRDRFHPNAAGDGGSHDEEANQVGDERGQLGLLHLLDEGALVGDESRLRKDFGLGLVDPDPDFDDDVQEDARRDRDTQQNGRKVLLVGHDPAPVADPECQTLAVSSGKADDRQDAGAGGDPDGSEPVPEFVLEGRRVLEPEDVDVPSDGDGVESKGHRTHQEELEADLEAAESGWKGP